MDKKTQLSASIVAGMASFLAPFMGASINIALPSIGREFGASAVTLGWVATSYLLAAAVCLVPFGRLADIYGRKRNFLWGTFVYTVFSFLCALSNSTAVLIFFRLMQGVGAALIFGTAVAILTSVFPPGERGKALGINTAATYLGLSLGPVLGGLLTEHLGWRSIFLANVPIGLAIIALVMTSLKREWAEAQGEAFDSLDSVIYGLALVALMLGLSRLPQTSGIWLLAVGLAFLAVFISRQMKTPSPVLDISLFLKNRVFAFSNLAALVNYSATFAVAFFLSLYLQYIKGLSPESAGLIMIAQPAVMALFSPAAGRASDRIEPRLVASVGMALSGLGLLLLAFLHAKTSVEFIIGSLAVLGFGFALFSSPNTNAVMSSVEKRFLGIGAATLATMRLVGQMTSMAIAMMIVAIFLGHVQITPANQGQFMHSVRVGFAVFSVLCLLGVFASLARGNHLADNN